MFIKSALAMLITVGFAGGAVYYGTGGQEGASNEVELRAPEKIKPVKTPAKNVDKPTDVAIVETVKPNPVVEPAAELEEIAKPISELEPAPPLAPEPEPKFDLAKIMPLLMKQTEKIAAVEIKDQAYLDIVNFSVSQRQFKFADSAMQAIDQTELRDTARSQIAIGLALDGRADDAFEVIDAVEIDTLRDVMRLQVIEALIVPGKLPPGLVRQ